ncbi:MAG: alpha/beta hydrolase [Arenibacter sp.]|nr:alpha/beta hydrolase [Arenibacter sp.]
MRKLIILLFLGTVIGGNAQEITFKKGVVMDSISVKDSISETFSLYLPSSFELGKNWPILFVFDMEGKGKQALSMFRVAAEDQGYILAASDNLSDTLSTSQNIMIAGRLFNTVVNLLPIKKNRTYVGGFAQGGQFASVLPLFINGISGVLSSGAVFQSLEVMKVNQPFYFIGVVGREDFAYQDMLATKSKFDKLKFPNLLMAFDGGHQWPESSYFRTAMERWTLYAMEKGYADKDSLYINKTYSQNLAELNALINSNKLLEAYAYLEGMEASFGPLRETDTLREIKRELRRDKGYKAMKRNENSALLKESFILEDYHYYLEEDIATYNFKNIGWWMYQMEELKKYEKSKLIAEQQMGKRLLGFVNALIEDKIDLLESEKEVDYQALSLLWMLKTITQPKEYSYYLKIISYSAKIDDYGTSLFYLEELLKNGYTDKEKLYELENTALLRITPEFNEIVEKYLKKARYEVIEE